MKPTPYYPTLTAFVEHVESLPWREGTLAENAGFAGGTLKQAVRLATLGWSEGAARAASKARSIADRVLDATSSDGSMPSIEYDVAGAAFDAGAVALGIPEAWARPSIEVARRAIRLVMNVGASAGITNEIIERRGIAVVALALTFAAKGYPVTIDVHIGNKDQPSKDVTIRVADAASGSPLDVDRVTYALAHPTMLRHLQRANYNGYRNGTQVTGEWGNDGPNSNAKPEGAMDLFMGGTHYQDVERWKDGGESWILAEYARQTSNHKGDN